MRGCVLPSFCLIKLHLSLACPVCLHLAAEVAVPYEAVSLDFVGYFCASKERLRNWIYHFFFYWKNNRVFEVSFLDNFFRGLFWFCCVIYPNISIGVLRYTGHLGTVDFLVASLQLMVYFWLVWSHAMIHGASAAVRRSATWWQSFKIKPAPLKRRFELCFSAANLSVNKRSCVRIYVKQRCRYLALRCHFALNATLSVPIKSLSGMWFLVGLFLWSDQVNDRAPSLGRCSGVCH